MTEKIKWVNGYMRMTTDHETIVNRLIDLYPTNSLCVATICDEVLDRSGELLGHIRERVEYNKQTKKNENKI